MADFSFGNDEENAELKKLNSQILEDSDSFEAWEKLVRAAESIEGGLNRNSNPQAISFTRDSYDKFLAKFPLLFGYWKKYADLEFSIAGTEAAELVYERGIASITNSVDLWTNYCSFKVETSHDPDIIRDLFERGAAAVGLDFLAHPFWDKYLEFEERVENRDAIFYILGRIIHVPMHQYARYFERYRSLAQTRPLQELAQSDVLEQFLADVRRDGYTLEHDIERETRTRLDAHHLEQFQRTQTETTKRWTYESEIKRPYFHVTDIDEAQMANWRKYLDFEEAEGDFTRITFLYERCLVTCALYDEFWLRFARWMISQPNKEEEVRNIYQRASMVYVPIAHPKIRLQYAYFEESCGRVEVAKDIHYAILIAIPGSIDTIVSLANLCRRHGGIDAGIHIYKEQVAAAGQNFHIKAWLHKEWARLLWRVKGDAKEAREIFEKNGTKYLESRAFWTAWMRFEIEQPTSRDTEAVQYSRIKQVFEDIREKSHLSPDAVQELTDEYFSYILERGTDDVAKEYMTIDREVNGPFSVRKTIKEGSVKGEDTVMTNGPSA